MAKKQNKKENRTLLVQFRVSLPELQEIHTKALVYSKGKFSDYLRLATLGYRPLKRVAK